MIAAKEPFFGFLFEGCTNGGAAGAVGEGTFCLTDGKGLTNDLVGLIVLVRSTLKALSGIRSNSSSAFLLVEVGTLLGFGIGVEAPVPILLRTESRN